MAKHTKSPRELQRIAAQKVRDADYKNRLLILRAHGIYNPEDKTLTKHRKATINKRYEEFKEFLDDKKYIYVDAARKGQKAKRQIVKSAKQLQMPVTHSGVFVKRGFYKTASIKKYERAGGDEYSIVMYGNREQGRKKQKASARIPLAPLVEIDRQESRLLREVKRLGKLKQDERYVFVIKSNGGGADGWSKNTFSDFDDIMHELRTKYTRSNGAFIDLMRHVEIVKYEDIEEYYEDHPDRSPSTVKADRRRKKRMEAKARLAGYNPH